MKAENIRDAAVGAAFGEIFKGVSKAITHVTKRSIHFQSYLEGLKYTLSILKAIPHEELGGSPGGEIKRLDKLVEKGEKLVNECSKLNWWRQSIRFAYADKLRNLEKELLAFFQSDIMARIMKNSSETLKLVIEVRERVNPPTETSTIDHDEGEGSALHGEHAEDIAATADGSMMPDDHVCEKI